MVGSSIMKIIPDDRHDEERFILDQIARGDRLEHYETVRQRKDGRLINISLTVSPIRCRRRHRRRFEDRPRHHRAQGLRGSAAAS